MMNPNAPEHQPAVARDTAIITLATTKLWSAIDPHIDAMLNKKVKDRDTITARRIALDQQSKITGRKMKLPRWPGLCQTPSPTISNVGTGMKIDIAQGLFSLDIKNGTPRDSTQAYLEFICDYANHWHTLTTGRNHRSPSKDPLYYFLDPSFHSDIMSLSSEAVAQKVASKLRPKQFWSLKYLFIIIEFIPLAHLPERGHIAFCAICPDVKSVAYICSGGDNGLPKSSARIDGSKCVPAIFNFLASYLSLPTSTRPFLPSEWTFSGSLSHLQVPGSSFCGQYTTTQALCLAFGYGLGSTFPSDHQKLMVANRRRRYHQDLMLNGFTLYDASPQAENRQYYPLLTTSSTQTENLTHPQNQPQPLYPLPQEVLSALPARILRRRSRYLNCPSKALLTQHCLRNFRFYPQYLPYAMDDKYGLKEYVEWVEEQDWKRRHGKSKNGVDVLDYAEGSSGPQRWVDPRERRKEMAGMEDALWAY